MSEAVMIETYVGENTEGLVGRVQVSRLGDSLRVSGHKGAPRFTPSRKRLAIASVALIAAGMALSLARIPGAAIVFVAGVGGVIYALFIGSDFFVRVYPASCIRMIDADSLTYTSVGGLGAAAVSGNPYRLAFEVTDSRGRTAHFILNPESPEQVGALLYILAP